MLQKAPLKITLLFLSLLFSIALLMSSTVSFGVTSVNVDLLYFIGLLLSFFLIGYGLSYLRLRGGPRRRKKSRYAIISGLLWIIAFGVAVYLLFNPRPSPQHPTNQTGIPHPGSFQRIKGGIEALYNALPSSAYLIPYLLLIVVPIFLIIKRRLGRSPSIGGPKVRFEPDLRYEDISGPPKERVIRMYRNVVAGLVLKGYPYQKSWTHREHEERLREIFPDLGDLDVLTRLFEKAKYADRLEPEDVKLARESYERLMRYLR
ncbi:hypothetical protein A3L09_06660 [Thermococcus profundus]|uniref:Protein-glutamine gamma-glutamyltransferase-like C-terminal domain-containing protein n=1 Tax=Thermococcus profundus TaxID=49899 RepID=A0A2Z2M8Y6_THEPR|nr:DUF4129 domain-containing protein [Thermococcus profundus]ASJ02960.1 hypothetical protein A3L09_06660 [Thermococcus profundus]